MIAQSDLIRQALGVGISLAALGIPSRLQAEEGPWEKQSIVYKTVGSTQISADVYRRNGMRSRPAVVWIHGGALISGSRDSVPRNIGDLCKAQDYVLVSLDYRLAPEVKLPAIIEDIKDAFTWLRTRGAEDLHIDTKRILVAGGSAGGYLTMMSGICVDPRPQALVSYWGYGDVDGPWYTEPSPHYRKLPLIAAEEAKSGVGKEVVTVGSNKARGTYYLYLRQNGLWTKEVTGLDPKLDRSKLDPFCPVRNVTPQYPPIIMVHGTADDDVPYERSVDMAKALEKHGVKHELITIPNGGHGLGNADKQLVADAQARVAQFIVAQLE